MCGCGIPTAVYTPEPVPVALEGGALAATATVDGQDAPFAVVIDTGTPLTFYDDLSGVSRGRLGTIRLFSAGPTPVPRLEVRDVRLFTGPLGAVGVGDAPWEVGGVLGGDNLGRLVVGLDYRGAAPALRFQPIVSTCSCDLADACEAVFPFTLNGGTQSLVVGGDLYSYPPTRLILDVCLEPLPDPITRDQPCHLNPNDPASLPEPAYRTSGVDVRLLVSTGFPGFALGASAWDRLRGAGAARALMDGGATVQVHLPDQPAPLRAGRATLGQPGLSALALVSRKERGNWFGPCALLARSRRQRRVPPPGEGKLTGTPRDAERNCLRRPGQAPEPEIANCAADPRKTCDDREREAPTPAVIELERPVPTLVLDDDAPLLQAINADARPQLSSDRVGSATVEGIIGTEVLARLVTTIDYPKGRFIARCADAHGCLTYPRYVQGDDCGRTCTKPECLLPNRERAGECAFARHPGGLCPPAEPRP